MSNLMIDREQVERRIEALTLEHRDLDEVIYHLHEIPTADRLHIQRIKKRKLVIKDMIAKLRDQLIPDLDA
ncbi:MAG: DUF465 domain-containing protein [Gammaproteobacteria bacterium]|nr:DUF465 domain-containing protein [Gammaproteobacteria bacterium]